MPYTDEQKAFIQAIYDALPESDYDIGVNNELMFLHEGGLKFEVEVRQKDELQPAVDKIIEIAREMKWQYNFASVGHYSSPLKARFTAMPIEAFIAGMKEDMKITEISKGPGWSDDDVRDFKHKLTDPAAYELQEIANTLNQTASRGYSFNAYNADKELGTIIGKPPLMDIETQEGNIIASIKALVNSSQHWAFKAYRGDVEDEFAVYVVRK